jgi:hypothetical protein
MNGLSKILTPSGECFIKDLSVGDELLVPNFKEVPNQVGGVDPESISRDWYSENLSVFGWEKTTIVEKMVEESRQIYFNESFGNTFARQQKIFIKRLGRYLMVNAAQIIVGDYLVVFSEPEEHREMSHLEVLNIGYENPEIIYRIRCEPYGWFICGNNLLYNK